MHNGGSVYILTNYSNNLIYVGVTSQLFIRIQENKEGKYPDCFTQKYNCKRLVYFETFLNIEEAIAREKSIKNWRRQWKLNLINAHNPTWKEIVLNE